MTTSDDNLLTVDDAADYLKVSPRTVRNYLVRRFGALPHCKPAGRVLIRRKDLTDWLNGKFKTKRRKVGV